MIAYTPEQTRAASKARVEAFARTMDAPTAPKAERLPLWAWLIVAVCMGTMAGLFFGVTL